MWSRFSFCGRKIRCLSGSKLGCNGSLSWRLGLAFWLGIWLGLFMVAMELINGE